MKKASRVTLGFCLLSLFYSPALSAAPLNYTEPPDIPQALPRLPNDIGKVDIGINLVKGTISDDFAIRSDDQLDTFGLKVPSGLVVTNIELVITEFSATDSDFKVTDYDHGRANLYTGESKMYPFFRNATFPNLIPTETGMLEEGDYALSVFSINVDFDDAGSVSFAWEFIITVAQAAVPANPTTWARIKRLYAADTSGAH